MLLIILSLGHYKEIFKLAVVTQFQFSHSRTQNGYKPSQGP